MSRKKRVLLIALGIILALAAAGFLYRDQILRWVFRPTGTSIEQGVSNVRNDARESIEVIAEDLDIPWEVAFLPSGEALVTERTGTLKLIGGQERAFNIDGVEHVGEGGLLGVVLHPDYAENNWIYLYFTTRESGQLSNNIVRFELRDNKLSKDTDILTGIPASSNHNGGRMAFGPDKYLYVGTGDAANASLAQDTESLAGKILRLRDSGVPAPNNPFGNEVYSYGHRNVQGMAWDKDDKLWATEHGPSAHDEINLITSGSNYGWPTITGDQTSSGMKAPVRHSGADETWAPSGMTYTGGSLFFGGLRGQSLYQAKVDGQNLNLKAHFRSEYGRIRTAVAHRDSIYILTSNTDGRGSPSSGDDKLVRLSTTLFD
jgi:glucose/arabinose dehydrogenase